MSAKHPKNWRDNCAGLGTFYVMLDVHGPTAGLSQTQVVADIGSLRWYSDSGSEKRFVDEIQLCEISQTCQMSGKVPSIALRGVSGSFRSPERAGTYRLRAASAYMGSSVREVEADKTRQNTPEAVKLIEHLKESVEYVSNMSKIRVRLDQACCLCELMHHNSNLVNMIKKHMPAGA
jgi:hypothetical protein